LDQAFATCPLAGPRQCCCEIDPFHLVSLRTNAPTAWEIVLRRLASGVVNRDAPGGTVLSPLWPKKNPRPRR
jgi:hypothetical protein